MCCLLYSCSLPPCTPAHVLIQSTSEEKDSHSRSPFGDVMWAVLAEAKASPLPVRRPHSISSTLGECMYVLLCWMQGESGVLYWYLNQTSFLSGSLSFPSEKDGSQRFTGQSQRRSPQVICSPEKARNYQTLTSISSRVFKTTHNKNWKNNFSHGLWKIQRKWEIWRLKSLTDTLSDPSCCPDSILTLVTRVRITGQREVLKTKCSFESLYR